MQGGGAQPQSAHHQQASGQEDMGGTGACRAALHFSIRGHSTRALWKRDWAPVALGTFKHGRRLGQRALRRTSACGTGAPQHGPSWRSSRRRKGGTQAVRSEPSRTSGHQEVLWRSGPSPCWTYAFSHNSAEQHAGLGPLSVGRGTSGTLNARRAGGAPAWQHGNPRKDLHQGAPAHRQFQGQHSGGTARPRLEHGKVSRHYNIWMGLVTRTHGRCHPTSMEPRSRGRTLASCAATTGRNLSGGSRANNRLESTYPAI